MKSIQLIKQVNNTELGKGGTHETYILVPQDLDVSDLFEEIGKEYSFKDKNSDKKYTIRLTWGREKRIVGMGPYYRDYDVLAGDRVLLEKNIQSNGEFNYYISFQRSIDTAYFQKVKNHFEALDSDKASAFVGMQFLSADGDSVKIEYYGEIQKRKDSPIMTKVYDVIVENQNIQGNYQDRDMIALKLQDGKIQIKDVQPWAKYVIEVKK